MATEGTLGGGQVCLCEKVEEILDRYNRDVSQLISILQDIQEDFRYLPKEALEKVSEALGVPMAQVYAVATFFKAFSLKPKGRHVIQVCMGTACHVRGAPLLLDKFERELGIKSGETSADLAYTLESVNCVGACALGPVVILNGELEGHCSQAKADSIIKKVKGQTS